MHRMTTLYLTFLFLAAPLAALDPIPDPPTPQPNAAALIRTHLDDVAEEVARLLYRRPDASGSAAADSAAADSAAADSAAADSAAADSAKHLAWQQDKDLLDAHLRLMLERTARLEGPEAAVATFQVQLLRARLAGTVTAPARPAERLATPLAGAEGALGTITGTVRNTSGRTLAGITVTVFDLNFRVAGSVVTSGNGRFRVSNLEPGIPYFAYTTNQSGYVDHLYPGIPCFGGIFVSCENATSIGTRIMITAGSTTSGIDFRLERGAAIQGRVRRIADRTVVPGLTVQLWSRTGRLLANAITDSKGRYRIDGIPSEIYYLSTRNDFGLLDEVYQWRLCDSPTPGPRCDIFGGRPLGIAAGTTLNGLDFNLYQLSRVDGTITDAATGAPLPFVTVILWNLTNYPESATITDETGRFVLGSRPPGTFYVTTQNMAGYVDEAYPDTPCEGPCNPPIGTPVGVPIAGSTTVDFALERGGAIAGRVTTTGTGAPPPEGGTIHVLDSEGKQVSFAFLDENGRYEARGLLSGSYVLAVNTGLTGLIDELYDNIPCFFFGGPYGCTLASGTPVVVTQGETTSGINFVLDPAGLITGTVTDEAGAPLGNVTLFATNAQGRAVGSPVTDIDGRYHLTIGLIPGNYYVRTQNPYGLLDELYDDIPCFTFNGIQCDPAAGTPIPYVSGQTTEANFVLQRGGSIRGRVTSELTGLPLSATFIYLWQGDRLVGVGQADEGGFYQLGGLPTGSYTANTQANVSARYSGEVDQVYDGIPCTLGDALRCDPTLGTPIAVTVGAETAGIDFRLRGPESSACVPSATHPCLQGGRFRVDVGFLGPNMDAPRLAHALPITADTSAFWFQRADNLELVIKVLNACASQGYFRVFAAGLTNLQVEIVITDTVTGEKRTYYHPGGTPFPPIQDTRAFATCGTQGP